MSSVEEELLRQGPESVRGLLAQAQRPLSDLVNWHGLAEGAGFEAHTAFTNGATESGLAWSSCATSLYDALSADNQDSGSFDLSAMYVRVNAMRHCGVLEGDPVRDPAVVMRWCRAAITGSADEALESTARLMETIAAGAEVSLEEARRLRRIKNRLGVLAFLAEFFELDSDLHAWIAARSRIL